MVLLWSAVMITPQTQLTVRTVGCGPLFGTDPWRGWAFHPERNVSFLICVRLISSRVVHLCSAFGPRVAVSEREPPFIPCSMTSLSLSRPESHFISAALLWKLMNCRDSFIPFALLETLEPIHIKSNCKLSALQSNATDTDIWVVTAHKIQLSHSFLFPQFLEHML